MAHARTPKAFQRPAATSAVAGVGAGSDRAFQRPSLYHASIGVMRCSRSPAGSRNTPARKIPVAEGVAAGWGRLRAQVAPPIRARSWPVVVSTGPCQRPGRHAPCCWWTLPHAECCRQSCHRAPAMVLKDSHRDARCGWRCTWSGESGMTGAVVPSVAAAGAMKNALLSTHRLPPCSR